MKKAPASKSSISLAEMPRWVKDRTAAKNTALKIKGNHGTNRKVPTKTKSMTDLKKSASTSKFGGKFVPMVAHLCVHYSIFFIIWLIVFWNCIAMYY